MKIFTNQQIKELTSSAMTKDGSSLADHIEVYAESAAIEIISLYPPSRRFIVFAGPGGNGADTLAVARHLYGHGYRPLVYLFNIGGNRLSPETAAERDRLLAEYPEVDFQEVVKSYYHPDPEVNQSDVVIDGMFGTGLKETLSGGFKVVVQEVNESGADIVSIDIPSGMTADWNSHAVNNNIIHATHTLVVDYPRLAFFVADNYQLVGNWRVIETGIDRERARQMKALYYLIQPSEIRPLLRQRNPFTSKADYGHGILFAGSYGMMGAAVMAATGALRAGIGKLTVHSAACGFNILQTAVPEALFQADQAENEISDFSLHRVYDAVAVGPGIGTDDDTVEAFARFLKTANGNSRPVILDADALNCIAARPSLMHHIPVLSVITPHAGEFDRLFGEHHSWEHRLRRAVEVARELKIFIILKGYYTAVVRPDNQIYFNSTGTPALATAGTGDVLTGILTAFMAQGYKAEIASLLAVYIHGVAGRIAAETHGDYGVTAMDVAQCVGQAIKRTMTAN